jgi:ABC-type phosphate transport system substrate-binding protein
MLRLRRKSPGKAGVRVALLSGAAVAALGLGALNAGSAAAAPGCAGSNITGKGSSLQNIAQTVVWGPGFSALCPGKTISYVSAGSGAGLAEWNANDGEGPINTEFSFIGTDDAPNTTQIANIQKTAGGAQLAVVPVAQTAIAIVAHPPVGCEVELVTNANLAAIFEGRVNNWKNVEGAEGECDSPITRAVRKDGSGTTFQLKNYLFQIYKKGLFCTVGGTEGKLSWEEMEPIGAESKPNISWPETCEEKTLSPVIRPANNGGGEVVKLVNATAGSIGYAALPDAKSNAKEGTVILALQNNGQKKGGEANFANAASGTTANCGGITYTGFKLSTGLEVDWSAVFGAKPSVGGKSYPLCTLTYDLAFHGYKNAGFAEGQELTARDYLTEYITQAATGQAAINSNFYSGLPGSAEPKFDVLGAAVKAAKTISY